MSKILVVGSSNTDLVANVERFPVAGETVEGKSFLQAMGGKGANQALAAHRSGGDVSFITCLGSDANGKNTLAYYVHEGLDISKTFVVDNAPTGTAIILVNAEGENCIVITPGANHLLSVEYIARMESEIASASMVVLQMEIPLVTVEAVCRLAAKHGTRILLNVAPAKSISTDIISMIDLLVVNETEIETISGQTISEIGEEGVIDTLLSKGAKTVILTLGSRGAIAKSKTENYFVPAYKVVTLDTTAAGDTFCGALVARLSNERSLEEALQFATAASAICVTRMGSQPSIPTEDEVNLFMRNYLKTANPMASNGHTI